MAEPNEIKLRKKFSKMLKNKIEEKGIMQKDLIAKYNEGRIKKRKMTPSNFSSVVSRGAFSVVFMSRIYKLLGEEKIEIDLSDVE